MNEARTVIHLMGTKISLYVKANDANYLIDEASQKLARYEQIFSANSEESQLAKLKNEAATAPQQIDPELYELIKIGKQHSLGDNNYLNIAIGPLIKLWRVGFKDANIPSEAAIREVLDLLNPHNIHLDDENKTISFAKKGIEIDLGCIAKGYFCDKIMDFFIENGAVCAMVDLGGNVLVYGDSPAGSDYWNIGIQNPFLPRGNIVASVKINNQSVVTSGIYERVFECNGTKYHHIFDSKTGYPVDANIASLTIIADKSIDCDIYTTKLFGLEPATIIQTVNKISGMSALVITNDGQLACTNDLAGKITMA